MKRLFTIGGLAALLIILAGAAYLLRPPAEASAPVEAVPLELDTPTPAPTEAAQPAESIAAPKDDGMPASEEVPPTASPASFEAAGVQVFAIVQEESEVRFSIDEILRNNPVTAVGATNQVAGEIAINFDDPSSSVVGIITVNARTLQTDSNNRDKAIRNEILDTGEYEFITFTPTSIAGLPAAIALGETVSFTISGDLTIRNFTSPTTFQVTAMVDESGVLSGHAQAVVLRADYALTIPSVPSVADVSEQVLLEIDFVAHLK